MKNKKLMWIIGIISLVAAASAALTAFLIVKDKQKKDDEELMEVGEMKYASEIPDEVYIERLNRINTSVKIPYNDVVRSYIIYYTQKMFDLIGFYVPAYNNSPMPLFIYNLLKIFFANCIY